MQRNSLITQSYPELPWAVLKNEDAPALCHHFLGFVFDTKEQLSPLFPWYHVRIMTLPFIPVVKFPETVWTLQLEKHTTKENSLFLGLCEERTQSNDQYSNESLLTFAQGKVHLFIYFAWCFSDFFFPPRTKGFFILSSWIATSSYFSVLGDAWPIKGSPRISFQQMHLKFIQDISDRVTHCVANTITAFVAEDSYLGSIEAERFIRILCCKDGARGRWQCGNARETRLFLFGNKRHNLSFDS